MSDPFAWNLLLFYAALGLGAVLVLGAGFGLHHADPTVDLHHDLHGNFHLDAHGSMHEESLLAEAFSFFSLGRVPITIALMIVCFFFGAIGLVSATLLETVIGSPSPWLSVLGASIATAFTAPPFARLIARILPTTETYAQEKRDLIGCSGILTLASDETSGTAQILSRGNILNVFVRTKTPLPKGKEIVLVDYVEGTDVYTAIETSDMESGKG